MNKGKTFLILGASSDLGLALVRKLNEDYADSTFCLHYHTSSEALEALPFSNGNSRVLLQADLSSDEDVL